MSQRVSKSINTSKVPSIQLAPQQKTFIVELMVRQFDRLASLHALAVVSKDWNTASEPAIRSLREIALNPGHTTQPQLSHLSLEYAQSRLVNHGDEEAPTDLQAISHGFVCLVSRYPAGSSILKYACAIVPHLKRLTNHDWSTLQKSLPQDTPGLRLFQLTACYSPQSSSIFQDQTTLSLEQFSLQQQFLLPVLQGVVQEFERLLDQVVKMNWAPESVLALLHALQSMAGGAGKQAAVEAILKRNPPLRILLDALHVKDLCVGPSGKPLKKPDVQLRCLVLAKLFSHQALGKETDAAKSVMLAVSDCADGLSGKEAKSAFFGALTTHFENLKPLALQHPDLLILICKRARNLQSACKEAKAFLARLLPLHGISYKDGTLITPMNSES